MDRLTAKKAAGYLGLKPGTLAAWRWRGIGPAYIKIGRRIRYELSALDAFLQAGKISPSSHR